MVGFRLRVGAIVLSWMFAVGLLGAAAMAKPTTPASAPGTAASAQPAEAQLLEHGHYVNKSGNVVHSPAHTVTGAVPAGASAQCRDGSYSFSQHHSGTCSHHGGVDHWF